MNLTRTLRFVTLTCCAAGTAFWLYTFYHISQLPQGDGTGFQWIAEVPLTGIFLLLTLPALALCRSDRTVAFATLLGAVSLILYAVLWAQLLNDFQPG